MYCFICNKLMVDKVESANQCEKHSEHILQNAIRGKLKSQSILCKKCGNKINDEIDVEFVKFFSPINELFKDHMRPKDHGSGSSVKILGKIFDDGFSDSDVNYSDGTISPPKPTHSIDYIEKKVEIFANKSAVKNYTKKVEAEIKSRGEEPKKFEFITIESYDEKIFIPYIGLNIENLDRKIKLGYNKIASEFALSIGIPRKELNRTIEINEEGVGKIILTDNVFPYFSNSLFEAIYEEFAPLVEPNYPTHTLILFTQKKNNGKYILYCYIELYSTFQNYVILNHNYHKEENSVYHQTVLKSTITDLDEELISSLRKSHKMIKRAIKNENNLNPLEKTIRKRIDTLSADQLVILNKEVGLIEDYGLKAVHKRITFNFFLEEFESTPNYIRRAIVIDKNSIEKRAKKYYYAKLQRLLVVIQVTKYALENS